jgi:hypothetical protein
MPTKSGVALEWLLGYEHFRSEGKLAYIKLNTQRPCPPPPSPWATADKSWPCPGSPVEADSLSRCASMTPEIVYDSVREDGSTQGRVLTGMFHPSTPGSPSVMGATISAMSAELISRLYPPIKNQEQPGADSVSTMAVRNFWLPPPNTCPPSRRPRSTRSNCPTASTRSACAICRPRDRGIPH